MRRTFRPSPDRCSTRPASRCSPGQARDGTPRGEVRSDDRITRRDGRLGQEASCRVAPLRIREATPRPTAPPTTARESRLDQHWVFHGFVKPTVLSAASSLVGSRTAWAIVLVAMNSVKNTAPGDGSQHRGTFPSWFAMPCSPLRTPAALGPVVPADGVAAQPVAPLAGAPHRRAPTPGSRRPRTVDGCPPAGRRGRQRARPWRTGCVAPRVQPGTLPRDRPAHCRTAAMILPVEVSPGGNSRALTAATAPFRQQTHR